MTAPVATAPEPAPRRSAELVERLRARATSTPPHLRVVLGVCALILLVVVVAGIAAGGGQTQDTGVPPNTPPELQQPLQDLHDAVEGQ